MEPAQPPGGAAGALPPGWRSPTDGGGHKPTGDGNHILECCDQVTNVTIVCRCTPDPPIKEQQPMNRPVKIGLAALALGLAAPATYQVASSAAESESAHAATAMSAETRVSLERSAERRDDALVLEQWDEATRVTE